MKRVSIWLRKVSATWLMIGTLLIMAAFMAFVLPGQSAEANQLSGEAGSPDLSLFYPPEQLKKMASDYGVEGRQAYIQARWTFDLAFPLVYVSFLAVGISWFINRLDKLPPVLKLSNLIPILGGIFDLLENTGTSLSMAQFPDQDPFWLILASLATPVKWILVSGSFVLYFVLGVWLLYQKINSGKR